MNINNPVMFVGAGPGDPELITLKAGKLLNLADVIIYAGSLVNPALLDGLTAEIHNSAGLDLEEIINLMATGHGAGKRVVRLHTGDPAFYGAIHEQMRALDNLGIPYEIVPGVTSATAAAAALKIELTVPGISQTVIFTRQAGRTPTPDRESLSRLAAARATMMIFLSVSLIDTVVKELLSGGYSGQTPAAVVEKAGWPDERIVRGCLDDIGQKVAEAGIRKTAMIVVGDVLGKSGDASKLYDAAFSHEYRQGKVIVHRRSI